MQSRLAVCSGQLLAATLLCSFLAAGQANIPIILPPADPPAEAKAPGEKAPTEKAPLEKVPIPQPGNGKSTLTPEDPKSPPGLIAPPAAVDNKKYRIGPEDVLSIRVWREQEHSGTVSVSPEGKITMPLVGEIQAGGLTPDELAASFQTALSKFLTDPQVQVVVQAVLSKRYYMTGEIRRAGPYPLLVKTTVSQAIMFAGGLQEYANAKKIRILRGTKIYFFNFRDFLRGKGQDKNIPLEDGDYIIIR